MEIIFKRLCRLWMVLLACAACQVEHKEVVGCAVPAPQVAHYVQSSHWFKAPAEAKGAVDVFYCYPTCWTPHEGDGLFCDIHHPSLRDNVPESYHKQAQLFESFANIYVPWYRQIDERKFLGMTHEEQTRAMRKIPYRDVVSAFDYYLHHFNHGRPFILVGHSQGAYVLKMLLQDYFSQHPGLMKRMVVAYLLGYSFEDSYFVRNPHLKYAKGETDTGVIVSWNCEPRADSLERCPRRTCHPGAMSINPITWRYDYEAVEMTDSTFHTSGKGYGTCRVQVEYDPSRDCDVLAVTDGAKGTPSVVGKLRGHDLDFCLFRSLIKENAQKRIQAFFKWHTTTKRR